jgi:hypothetical protein
LAGIPTLINPSGADAILSDTGETNAVDATIDPTGIAGSALEGVRDFAGGVVGLAGNAAGWATGLHALKGWGDRISQIPVTPGTIYNAAAKPLGLQQIPRALSFDQRMDGLLGSKLSPANKVTSDLTNTITNPIDLARWGMVAPGAGKLLGKAAGPIGWVIDPVLRPTRSIMSRMGQPIDRLAKFFGYKDGVTSNWGRSMQARQRAYEDHNRAERLSGDPVRVIPNYLAGQYHAGEWSNAENAVANARLHPESQASSPSAAPTWADQVAAARQGIKNPMRGLPQKAVAALPPQAAVTAQAAPRAMPTWADQVATARQGSKNPMAGLQSDRT